MPDFETLTVRLKGDASSLFGEFNKSVAAAKAFESRMDTTGRKVSRSFDNARRSLRGLSAELTAFKRLAGGADSTVTVDVGTRGTTTAIGELKALDSAVSSVDGETVNIDVDKSGVAALSRMRGGLDEAASSMRNFKTVSAGLVGTPAIIAAIGGIAPAATAAAGAVGQLSLGLGQGLVGAAAIGGTALAGMGGGLRAYTALIKSTMTASRELYLEENKAAEKRIENARKTAFSTQANKDFNRSLDDAQVAFIKLQGAVADETFPHFTKEIRAWTGVLGEFQDEIVNTAGKVSRVATNFSEWFRTNDNGRTLGRTIDFINDSTVKAAQTLSDLGKTGVRIFTNLIDPARRLQNRIVGVGQALNEWSASDEGQAQIKSAIGTIEHRMNQLITVAKNTGRAVGGVFAALNNQGGVDKIMGGLVRITGEFAKIMRKGGGARQAIVNFMDRSEPALNQVWKLAGTVASEFGKLANNVVRAGQAGGKMGTLAEVIKSLRESVRPLRKMFQETFIALGPAIADLIPEVTEFLSIFLGETGALKDFVRGMTRVLRIFNDLPEPVKDAVAEATAWTLILKALGAPGLFSFVGSLTNLSQTMGILAALKKNPFSMIKSGAKALGVFLLSPPGLAIAALAVTGFAIYKNWDKIGPIVKPLTDKFKALANQGAKRVKEEFEKAKRAVGNFLADIFDKDESTLAKAKKAGGEIGAKYAAAYKKKLKSDISEGSWQHELGYNIGRGLIKGVEGLFTSKAGNINWSLLWTGKSATSKAKDGGKKQADGFVNGLLIGIRSEVKKVNWVNVLWGFLKPPKFNGKKSLVYDLVKDIKVDFQDLKKWGGNFLKDALRKSFLAPFLWLYDRLVGHSVIPDLIKEIKKLFGGLPGAVLKKMKEFGRDLGDRWANMKTNARNKWEEISDAVLDKARGIKSDGLTKLREFGKEVGERWVSMNKNARERWGDIAGTVMGKARGLRDDALDVLKKLGEGIGTRWVNINNNAREKWDAFKTAVGTRVDTAMGNVRDRIDLLKKNLPGVWNDIVKGAKEFGNGFRRALVGAFGSAVNGAREVLGTLLGAIGWVLGKIGKNDLSDDFYKRSEGLKQNVDFFATGGIYDGGITSAPVAIAGEAGPEAIIPMKRKTRQGDDALRKAASAHGYGLVAKESRGGRSGGSIPPKQSWNLRGGDGVVDYWAHDWKSKVAQAARSWKGLVRPAPAKSADVWTDTLDLQPGLAGVTLQNVGGVGRIGLDKKSANVSTIAHEFGHALGLGHGGSPSVMALRGSSGRTQWPASNDFSALRKYFGIGGKSGGSRGGSGGGSGGSSGGGGGEPSYGNLKGRIDDSGGGAGQYGPTDNSLWTDDVFGRVIEVLKRFKVSANTYKNHPPGFPSLAGKSADFWGYGGRGTPIGKSMGDKVLSFINSDLSKGKGWSIWDGYMYDPGKKAWPQDPHRDHVHGTWTGEDPSTPNVAYQGGSSGPSMWSLISGWIASKFPSWSDVGGGVLNTMGEGLFGIVASGAKDWLLNSFGGDSSGGKMGTGGSLSDWIKDGLQFGNVFPASESNISKMRSRAMQESGGDPKAVNNWDSNAAAGTPSKGLFQIIEPTWNGYKDRYGQSAGAFDSNWSDPRMSAAVASRYMKGRYGHIVAANGQGYRRGGIIPGPEGRKVMIDAHSGERVLPIEVRKAFDRLAHAINVWNRKGGVMPKVDVDLRDREQELREIRRVLEKQEKKMATKEEMAEIHVSASAAFSLSKGNQRILNQLLSASMDNVLHATGRG